MVVGVASWRVGRAQVEVAGESLITPTFTCRTVGNVIPSMKEGVKKKKKCEQLGGARKTAVANWEGRWSFWGVRG